MSIDKLIEMIAGAGTGVAVLLFCLVMVYKDMKRREQKFHDLTQYIIRDSKAREEKCQAREEQSALREANYQRTINELVKKFDMIEEVQESFQDMQRDIEAIKESLEK